MSHFEMKQYVSILILAAFWGLNSTPAQADDRQPAAIQRVALLFEVPKKDFTTLNLCFSPENLNSYQQVKASQKAFDPSDIVPLDLKPTEDSGRVFSKIADQSVSSFFHSSQVQATPFGRASTEVEQKLKQDVVLSQGDIQHKFSFQVQAFQSSARLEYTGFTRAALVYAARDASTGLEVLQNLKANRDLIFAHTEKPDDKISSVSLRWNY